MKATCWPSDEITGDQPTAKDPVVRQIVVHHIKGWISFSLAEVGVLIRRSENARREGGVCLAGFQNKNLALRKTALESTLPPHNDSAARRLSERIESCFHPQSEFLLHDLRACPSRVQDASGPHGNRAG